MAEKLLALNQKKLELWTNSVAIHALCNGSGKQKMEIFFNALILRYRINKVGGILVDKIFDLNYSWEMRWKV